MRFTTADNLTPWRNLQLLAEDTGVPSGAAPAATPATEPAAPATEPPAPQTLAEFLQGRMAGEPNKVDPVTPPAATEPAPAAPVGGAPTPAPVTPDIIVPDKFKNPDGSVNVEAMAKSYINMEQLYSKSQNPQQFAELKETNQQLQELVATLKSQNEPAKPQMTPEQIQAQKEAEVDRLADLQMNDPIAYRDEMAKMISEQVLSTINPRIEPLVEHHNESEQVKAFSDQLDTIYNAKYKDKPEEFEALLPEMRSILLELGDDFYASAKNPVEIAHNLALGRRANTAPAAPTVEELLNNPDFVAKFTQNPAVKKIVVQQHMEDIKNNPTPPVMGAGGLPPSTAPVDLKDPKKAKEALMAKYAGVSLK